MELIIRTPREKKAYRLRCRFTVDAGASQDSIDKMKIRVAEKFVEDMKKQGWEYDPNKIEASQRGFTLKGPFLPTPITGLPKFHERIRFNSREALPRVMAGDPMRLPDKSWVVDMPTITTTDKWDYELSAVFIRPTIMIETNEEI